MEDEEDRFVFGGGGFFFDVSLVWKRRDLNQFWLTGARKAYAFRVARGVGGHFRACRRRGRCRNLHAYVNICFKLLKVGDSPAAMEK